MTVVEIGWVHIERKSKKHDTSNLKLKITFCWSGIKPEGLDLKCSFFHKHFLLSCLFPPSNQTALVQKKKKTARGGLQLLVLLIQIEKWKWTEELNMLSKRSIQTNRCQISTEQSERVWAGTVIYWSDLFMEKQNCTKRNAKNKRDQKVISLQSLKKNNRNKEKILCIKREINNEMNKLICVSPVKIKWG